MDVTHQNASSCISSWERVSKTDTKDKKLLNKVIFVFFDFIKNTLIWVPKMNEWMKVLWVTWGWVINDRILFLGELFL